jgi:hypothetical protein
MPAAGLSSRRRFLSRVAPGLAVGVDTKAGVGDAKKINSTISII